MVLIDSELSPSDRAFSEPEGRIPQPAPSGRQPLPGGMSRLLALACVAGLIAGMASLIAGEEILSSYKSDLNPSIQNNPSPESVRRWKDARLYSATFTFTTLGGLLGLALGLAGGLARRSVSAGVRAAILGLLLGTVAAASVSLILVSIFYKNHDPLSSDLIFPLLTHGAIWSAVGAVGGLAFGLGLGGPGRWKATLVGGFTGAAAAAVVYELVGAIAFASSKTDLPLSLSSATRGMALLLVAGLSSIGAVLALRQPAKQTAKSSAPS